MNRALVLWTNGFVGWVLVFSLAALFFPSAFAALAPYIVYGLGAIMFGMGMTLTPADFRRVAQMPRAVACGVLGQFLIMPFAAWLIATAFRLQPELAMGFIIVGSCPGGTASNVIAYLARGDVALSVTMTASTTLLAIVATPLLVGALGGEFLPVDSWGLFLSVVQIVLIPVAAGLFLRTAFPKQIERALEFFPAFSVLVIVLVIAAIVAKGRNELPKAFGLVGALVVMHNLIGLGLGYGLAALLRLPIPARRAIAIEVGMQNSGLGIALATAHFKDVLVALPSTIFSVVHNLTGSALASFWRNRQPAPEKDT